MTPEALPYTETIRDVNGVRLQMASAGEAGRPLVILLHGFPDLWQGWHFQIPKLVASGFRVIAPNLRGYGKSDKPVGISAYDLDFLANDVIGIADSENCAKFNIVGHDWGGVVAWWVAANYADRVSRSIVLNAPHPGVFKRYALRHPRQALRSWYAGFFQIPKLPEALLSAGDYELLFRSVKHTSQPGVFDESDRQYLVAGWSEKRALLSMLNYYRALVRRSSSTLQKRISTPTLIQFSKQDPALEPGLAEASLAECDDGRLIWLEGARHWIQREEHERVSENICRFLLAEPVEERCH
jgi:pimeloyl-ACP methyl ester carboxylesterase